MQIINAIPIAMFSSLNSNHLCKIYLFLVLKLFYSFYQPQYGVYNTANILADFSPLACKW